MFISYLWLFFPVQYDLVVDISYISLFVKIIIIVVIIFTSLYLAE